MTEPVSPSIIAGSPMRNCAAITSSASTTQIVLDVSPDVGSDQTTALHLAATDGSESLTVHTERIIDNGPFYHRYVVRGPGAPGIGERVVPARIDHPLVRPFVHMSTWPAQGRSFLAPWFLGPRHDRMGRLLSAWSQRLTGRARPVLGAP